MSYDQYRLSHRMAGRRISRDAYSEQKVIDTGGADSHWIKSYGVSSNLNLDSIAKWGFVAAAFLGIYFILIPDAWTKMKYFWCHDLLGKSDCDETSADCPPGYHSVDPCVGLSGLPLNLCQLGSWSTGSKCELNDQTGGYVPFPNPIPVGNCTPLNESICTAFGDYWHSDTCTCEDSGFTPIDNWFGGGGAGGR